jgi:hypothetical protein
MTHTHDIIEAKLKKYSNFAEITNKEEALKDILESLQVCSKVRIKEAICDVRNEINQNLHLYNYLAQYFIEDGSLEIPQITKIVNASYYGYETFDDLDDTMQEQIQTEINDGITENDFEFEEYNSEIGENISLKGRYIYHNLTQEIEIIMEDVETSETPEIFQWFLMNNEWFIHAMEKAGAVVVKTHDNADVDLTFWWREACGMSIFADSCIERLALDLLKTRHGIDEAELCKYFGKTELPSYWLMNY